MLFGVIKKDLESKRRLLCMKALNKRKTTCQWFVAIFAVLFLGIVAVLTGIRMTYAANVQGWNVNSGITATYDNGTWSANGTTINGSVTTQSASGGCGSTTYTPVSGTLTLTNNSGNTGILSLDVAATLNSGSCTPSDGSYSYNLENGESVTVKITSREGAVGTTSVIVSNIKIQAIQEISVTFELPVPANGSYKVNGESVTETTTINCLSNDPFVLTATANTNYKFLGWYNSTTSSYISYSNPTDELYFSENCSIYPVFCSKSTPMFKAKGVFTDLNDAIDDAVENSVSTVILISDGTLPSGSYTIPSGKTLLIPFDDANTVYTTSPEVAKGDNEVPSAWSAPSAYRTLTMAENSIVTVNGSISVPSKISATGTGSSSRNGTPTGKHGRIAMAETSKIVLNNNSNLYCYGYISGNGIVEATSGSKVYECFQIRSWRGGNATSDLTSEVFPMNQYYVQNIEARLFLYSGATEYVCSTVNARRGLLDGTSTAYPFSATFIGKTDGMFRVASGYIVKQFAKNRSFGADDRLYIEAHGKVSVSDFKLNIPNLPVVGNIAIDTGDFVMPITNNISIEICSGSELTISQDLAFLPGSKMTIDNGASVIVASGTNIYVYDQDEWGPYAGTGVELIVVSYSTVYGTTAKRSTADLVDAELDINGLLTINGYIYTTESGANIYSSEMTGIVALTKAAPNDTTTKQATQESNAATKVDINVTSVKLKNGHYSGKPAYTETQGSPANSQFNYAIEPNNFSLGFTYGWWNNGPYNPGEKTITYIVSDSITFDENYTPQNNYTFPDNSNENIPSTVKTIKRWINEDRTLSFVAGQEYLSLEDYGNLVLYPLFSGWDDLEYIPENGTIDEGLYTIAEEDSTTILNNVYIPGGSTCYFDSNSTIKYDFTGILYYTEDDFVNGDNNYYYIENGVVINNYGWYSEDSNYYYIGENGIAYTDGTYYIDSNGQMPGYFRFDNHGILIPTSSTNPLEKVTIDSSTHLIKDSQGNNTKRDIHGLVRIFDLDGENYLIYVDENGSAITNQTFYVDLTNNCYVDGEPVNKGVYYFDNQGHMYYGNDMLSNHDFEVITLNISQLNGGNN